MREILVLRSCPDPVLDILIPRIRKRFPGRRVTLIETSSKPPHSWVPRLRLPGRRFAPAGLRKILARRGRDGGIEAVVLAYNEADHRPFRGIEKAVLDKNIPLLGIDGRLDLPAASRRIFFRIEEADLHGRGIVEKLVRAGLRRDFESVLPRVGRRPGPSPRGGLRIAAIGDLSIRHFRGWVERMRDLGHVVTVFAPRTRERPKGIRVVDLGWPPPSALFFERIDLAAGYWRERLRERIHLFHEDIFVACFTWIVSAAALGLSPLVYQALGDDLLVAPRKIPEWRRLLRESLRRVDLATTYGSPLLAQALLRFGLPASRIETGMEGGVDLERFRMGRAPSARAPVVAFIRGYDSIYRSSDLLASIPIVRRAFPEARFYLSGRGFPPRRSLPGTRIRGVIPSASLVRLLSEARLFVSPAGSDASPRSLFEAMASGAIPVLSNLPAYRPWITQGRNGFFFPTGDPKALARTICEALELTQRGDLDAAAARNRRIVAERCDIRRNDERILSRYRALVRNEPRCGRPMR